ncbi:FAD/NAD(P)-binding domain-containing protein [Conidiobolus coronatus NRRL 28638]|uniref:FAD/NAD(P)-binding domain-containing protein n=1 Tax=Conidiobolus coronatus (strain ATCC 28846 / CBS 209.66 / NRRL 28638) TaxID=796925 RepID=A0A137P813_CONC2|nr:FAD/NAD(P)-binding domain-containing protein [Conidiobolus coronatus NRRL 28638]|eukprot:KXN71146.1 FAD/NAD(P)-binding domain-containing protein [Conidiobolus coronatus NRRL 28638]
MIGISNSTRDNSTQLLTKYPKPIQKVLVIGLGAAGILALRNLKKINKNNQISIKCFELTSRLGGIWNLDTLEKGNDYSDISGSNFVTPMYPSLTTNMPGKLMTINDLPELESDEVYPEHRFILRYLNKIVKGDNLDQFVSYNTKVNEVEYLIDEKCWLVKSLNLKTNETMEEKFDCVVDCSSFNNLDHIPNWEGLQKFKEKYPDRLIHSRYYRGAEEFEGKTIIVVGKGPSAMNIVQELSYTNCDLIQSSNPIPIYKRGDIFLPYAPNNPSNLPTFVAPIKSFEIDSNTSETVNDCIVLEDGTKLSIPDILISATGYEFKFITLPETSQNPLQPSTGSIIADKHTLKNLVLRTIYQHNPSYMTIGAITISSLIPLWDYQAHYVASTISMVNYFHSTCDSAPLLELVDEDWILNAKGSKDELITSRAIIFERFSFPTELSVRINRSHAALPLRYKAEFPLAMVDPPSNEWIQQAVTYSLGLPPYNRD